jgi:hypothetical protein
MGQAERLYCSDLSRDHTYEATEPQPDADGSPDAVGGQLMYLWLDAPRERDPGPVESVLEKAARCPASEAEFAGGVPAVRDLVTDPAGAWAATRGGMPARTRHASAMGRPTRPFMHGPIAIKHHFLQY